MEGIITDYVLVIDAIDVLEWIVGLAILIIIVAGFVIYFLVQFVQEQLHNHRLKKYINKKV